MCVSGGILYAMNDTPAWALDVDNTKGAPPTKEDVLGVICVVCKCVFVPPYEGQKTCSLECRRVHYNRRQTEKKNRRYHKNPAYRAKAIAKVKRYQAANPDYWK